MPRPRSKTHKLVVLAVLMLQIAMLPDAGLLVSSPAVAEPQILAQAREDYGAGQFDKSVQSLKQALAEGTLKGSDLAQGLEYLGCAYVRLGNLGAADTAFYQLLDQDRKWKADPDRLQTDELEAFNRAQARWLNDHPVPPPRRPWYTKKAFLGIGGVVAAGIAVALIRDPPPPPSALGDPPDPPTGQARPSQP